MPHNIWRYHAATIPPRREREDGVSRSIGMIIYARGSSLPPDIRSQDPRFSYQGKPSATALRRYWRLLSDGTPDPECKPYRTIWEIDLHHKAFPDMGDYSIQSNPIGRPKTAGDRTEYQRQYWLNRKERDQKSKNPNV